MTFVVQVRAGRMERHFIGPAWFFFRLYETPPDPAGMPVLPV